MSGKMSGGSSRAPQFGAAKLVITQAPTTTVVPFQRSGPAARRAGRPGGVPMANTWRRPLCLFVMADRARSAWVGPAQRSALAREILKWAQHPNGHWEYAHQAVLGNYGEIMKRLAIIATVLLLATTAKAADTGPYVTVSRLLGFCESNDRGEQLFCRGYLSGLTAKISQETLAEMIGTTRSRGEFFHE
jgi:hypothetical protein